METWEQRNLIRENYSLGRNEAEVRLSAVQSDSDREVLVLEGAQRMRSTDGYEYSLSQGFWQTVSNRPLCLVNIEEGAVA